MTTGGPNDPAWTRRSGSFGPVAAEYADHRPDYASAAVAWALGRDAQAAADVLDLGAGTGALTGVLARAGAAVTAVEPDPAMLAELGRRLPSVLALLGSAEALPVPDASFDLVTVATAFHWFDRDRAVGEIARVLRPGGRLALFYDLDDRERAPWLADLDRLKRTSASTPEPERDPSSGAEPSGELPDWPAHPRLGAWEQRRFPHTHRRTADSLTATIGTQSHTLVVSAQERAEVLARVRTFLGSFPETAEGEFEVPLWTVVARAEVVS